MEKSVSLPYQFNPGQTHSLLCEFLRSSGAPLSAHVLYGLYFIHRKNTRFSVSFKKLNGILVMRVNYEGKKRCQYIKVRSTQQVLEYVYRNYVFWMITEVFEEPMTRQEFESGR